MRQPINLSDQRVGYWTVLARVPPDATGHTAWSCVCICGTAKAVRQENLLNGSSQSCGCRAHEKPRTHRYAPARIPRGTNTPSRASAYHSWYTAVRRCTNPADPAYPRYGGRGITVCDRWQGWFGFDNFLADMGSRPAGMSLNRIDNDGHYEPGNCEWASARTQARNRRGVRLTPEVLMELLRLHRGGMPTADVAQAVGLSYKTTTLAIWIADTLAELHRTEPPVAVPE